MPARPLRVSRSRTGLGLFATKPFRKKAYIATYRGPLITNAEAEARERRGGRYLFELNSRWTIDGSSRWNLARYANHSCRPNAEAVERKRKIVLVARRAIKPGEEITYDYGKDYFDAFIKKSGCRCDKCREKRVARRKELKRAARRRAARRTEAKR
jgi:uncharacterized protein